MKHETASNHTKQSKYTEKRAEGAHKNQNKEKEKKKHIKKCIEEPVK